MVEIEVEPFSEPHSVVNMLWFNSLLRFSLRGNTCTIVLANLSQLQGLWLCVVTVTAEPDGLQSAGRHSQL